MKNKKIQQNIFFYSTSLASLFNTHSTFLLRDVSLFPHFLVENCIFNGRNEFYAWSHFKNNKISLLFVVICLELARFKYLFSDSFKVAKAWYISRLFKIFLTPSLKGAGKKLRYGSINYPANWALHFLRPNSLFPRHIGPWQIGPSKLSPQTEMEKREKLERCKFLPKNSTENKWFTA